MTSWQELVEQSGTSIEDLKAQLPLQYVINQAGVALEPVGPRLVGLCPFHVDTNPSFAVFGENLDVCGCWTCEFQQGDVLDFIGRFWGLDFSESMSSALSFLQQFKNDESWAPLVAEHETQSVSPESLVEPIMAAFEAGHIDPSAIADLLQRKDLNIPVRWLRENWWLGVQGSDIVVIPHYGPNAQPTGFKTRHSGSHAYAGSGHKFPELYGAWRNRGHKRAIICEGESDTWWVSYVFRDEDVDVFGIPTGANTACRAEWQEFLKNRHITLMFDGDGAGRGAARRWAGALLSGSLSTSVVVMRDRTDAATLSPPQLRRALRRAVEIEPWTPMVITQRNGYMKQSSGAMISDWTFKPLKFLDLRDDGFAFEGIISTTGERATISTVEFGGSVALARKWANRHKGIWKGTDREAQDILKLLLMDRPFLPEGRGTYRVGWHEGNFVTVTESYGPDDWTYLHSDISGEYETFITMESKPKGEMGEVVLGLLAMHQGWIIKPIIGWLMAALMRDAYTEFPILGVVGASGAGKTTVIDTVLSAFGFGGGEKNLTSTTRYGLMMLAGGSTGVPMWIDEYRPGAKIDTRMGLEQIMRDAWRKAVSVRGGQGSDLSRVVAKRANAPMIVSGEDMFSETSLIERVRLIQVPKDGRWRGPLDVRGKGQIGQEVVRWLVEFGSMPSITANTRVGVTDEIIEHGWGMFRRMVYELTGIDAGEMEDTPEAIRVQRHLDPVIEMVLWGLDQTDPGFRPLVWEADGRLAVRVRELVRAAREFDVPLPGGERAIQQWLIEEFDGGSAWRSEHGRALLLPPGSVENLKRYERDDKMTADLEPVGEQNANSEVEKPS